MIKIRLMSECNLYITDYNVSSVYQKSIFSLLCFSYKNQLYLKSLNRYLILIRRPIHVIAVSNEEPP